MNPILSLKQQIPRYIIISGLNTIFAYLLFALFIKLNFHYTLATLFPGVISIYLGYVANKKIVFKSNINRKNNILYYYLFYVVVYFVNISIQATLIFFGSNNDYINGGIATVLTAVGTFIINRGYFFKSKPE